MTRLTSAPLVLTCCSLFSWVQTTLPMKLFTQKPTFPWRNTEYVKRHILRVCLIPFVFQENLRDIINKLVTLENGDRSRVIIISSPPSDPPAWQRSIELSTGKFLFVWFCVALPYVCSFSGKTPPNLAKEKERDRAYSQVSLEVAQDTNVDSLDVYQSLDNPGNFSDGLHLNLKGSEILFDKILSKIP